MSNTNQSQYAQDMRPFIESLSNEEKDIVFQPFSDESREQWHYFPGRMWHSKGLAIKDLDASQKKNFYASLRSFVSAEGFQKTKDILIVEGVLGELTGNIDYRDPEKYYIAIYGDPTTKEPWSFTLEGHHLSLNFTVVNGQLISSPRFFGANPATVLSGEHEGLRALNQEEDLAFQLVNSFTEAQQNVANIDGRAYPEIITRNESTVAPIDQRGIKMSQLNGEQQELLWKVIQVYLSTEPEEEVEAKASKIRQTEFDDILFAWAGATTPGVGHYYRIQSDSFLIEFDNTQNGANHIHSVWREFEGDFGRDVLRDHYRNSGHH